MVSLLRARVRPAARSPPPTCTDSPLSSRFCPPARHITRQLSLVDAFARKREAGAPAPYAAAAAAAAYENTGGQGGAGACPVLCVGVGVGVSSAPWLSSHGHVGAYRSLPGAWPSRLASRHHKLPRPTHPPLTRPRHPTKYILQAPHPLLTPPRRPPRPPR